MKAVGGFGRCGALVRRALRSAKGAPALAARAVVTILVVSWILAPGAARATPVSADVSGTNGVVRTTEPGLSCADDGKGSYRHYFADAPLAGGVMSKLAGSIRSTLDVHYDGPSALGRQGPNAFLLGSESHATLSNQRGSVQVVLRGGTCQEPALTFNGTTAALPFPSGTWNSADGGVTGTGAYRQVSGSGTFGFSAEMNPGADNAWSLRLDGTLDVLQPGLTVKVERTFWGNLGLDYLSRVVSVVYRVGNTGQGDAFNALFKKADPTGPGVRPCAEPPSALNTCPNGAPPEQPLGDLQSCSDPALPASCDTELVTVRYQLAAVGGPCLLVVLGCQFQTKVDVDMADALDVASTKTTTVTVRAPDFPPPL